MASAKSFYKTEKKTKAWKVNSLTPNPPVTVQPLGCTEKFMWIKPFCEKLLCFFYLREEEEEKKIVSSGEKTN